LSGYRSRKPELITSVFAKHSPAAHNPTHPFSLTLKPSHRGGFLTSAIGHPASVFRLLVSFFKLPFPTKFAVVPLKLKVHFCPQVYSSARFSRDRIYSGRTHFVRIDFFIQQVFNAEIKNYIGIRSIKNFREVVVYIRTQ
jgi:hypothetical protein